MERLGRNVNIMDGYGVRHVADAARALNVHRNTLVHRPARIAERTGRDPRRFETAVTLRPALHLTELD